MAEKLSSGIEKGSQVYRNVSLGTAAVELAVMTAVPETAPIMRPLIYLNVAFAGLAEVVRRMAGGKKGKASLAPA